MQELLAHPAVQAAVVPFFVALAIALVFRKTGDIALGLAVIGGFLSTVMLTTGLSFLPLSSDRKIVLVSFGLPLLWLLSERWLGQVSAIAERWRTLFTMGVPTVLLVIAIIWVIWPVLSRQELDEAWPMLARVGLYVGMVGLLFLGVARLKRPEKSIVHGVSALVLGLGTAVTSMIAASALYSQWAFSIVAAVGSLLLMSLFANPQAGVKQGVGYLGSFGLFAAAVPLALLGAAATVYAQLSGWVLLCLAAVPLFAGWPRVNVERPWLRVVFTGLLAFLPVIPAIWIAWSTAESTGY